MRLKNNFRETRTFSKMFHFANNLLLVLSYLTVFDNPALLRPLVVLLPPPPSSLLKINLPWWWNNAIFPGNRNKGKGNGAGLAWESQSHCFAEKFSKPYKYTHSFVTDTQHDYSQGNCRTMLSIIIKLE